MGCRGSRAVREQKTEGQLVRVLSLSAAWGFQIGVPVTSHSGNSLGSVLKYRLWAGSVVTGIRSWASVALSSQAHLGTLHKPITEIPTREKQRKEIYSAWPHW